MLRCRLGLLCTSMSLVMVGSAIFGTRAVLAEPNDAALERTRRQVRMLDDLYKSAVVLITEHFVEEDSEVPAGTAAKLLFEAMEKKGWHKVRLVDVAGEPISDENVAQDPFEKMAVEELREGKPYVDEVVTLNGKPYLRAATPIPVVLDKCIACHPNYADTPAGKPIGMLAYTLPIE